LIALATRSATKQRKPKGKTKIGIIPQPDGTQVLFSSGANRITKIASTETITLPMKAKARYFSNKDAPSALLFDVDWILELGFLAILLEYWLG
jgi:hypothetical protein